MDEIIVEHRGKWSEIFEDKYFRVTVLLLIISMSTVFSYYGISFLSERYFELVTENNDEHPSEKYWKIVVTTSSEIPGVIIAYFILDTFGRKNTMIANYALFAISTFILMTGSVQNSNEIGIILSFFARMSISISFLALYVYYGEYYPTQIRNTAMGISVSITRFAGMATTFVSQYDDITYSFYLYGFSGIIAMICSLMLRYDTRQMDMTRNKLNSELLPIKSSSIDHIET